MGGPIRKPSAAMDGRRVAMDPSILDAYVENRPWNTMTGGSVGGGASLGGAVSIQLAKDLCVTAAQPQLRDDGSSPPAPPPPASSSSSPSASSEPAPAPLGVILCNTFTSIAAMLKRIAAADYDRALLDAAPYAPALKCVASSACGLLHVDPEQRLTLPALLEWPAFQPARAS